MASNAYLRSGQPLTGPITYLYDAPQSGDGTDLPHGPGRTITCEGSGPITVILTGFTREDGTRVGENEQVTFTPIEGYEYVREVKQIVSRDAGITKILIGY